MLLRAELEKNKGLEFASLQKQTVTFLHQLTHLLVELSNRAGRMDKTHAQAKAAEVEVKRLKEVLNMMNANLVRERKGQQETESWVTKAEKETRASANALRKAKAELAFEEERQQEMASRIIEGELKALEAKKVAKERIAKAGCLVVKAFKASEEFNDARIAFSREAFNTALEIGFNNCRHRVAAQLPTMNLSFLDEDKEEGATGEPVPFETAAIEEQVEEEPMVVGFFPSPTVDASIPMPAPPIRAPADLSGTVPNLADPQSEYGTGMYWLVRKTMAGPLPFGITIRIGDLKIKTRISSLKQARRNVKPEHKAIARNMAMVEPIPRESHLMVVGPQATTGSTPRTNQSAVEPASGESQPTAARPRVSRDLMRPGFPRRKPSGSASGGSNNLIHRMFDAGFTAGFTRCRNQIRMAFPKLDLYGLSKGDPTPAVPRHTTSSIPRHAASLAPRRASHGVVIHEIDSDGAEIRGGGSSNKASEPEIDYSPM
ncbi:hypothetical protein COCNU_04G000120 [Cocos nucifera]|uniref:Uncharacterized protein n=1 Tax=Cocos nucifera TaxID=13894 RepID=A0A8K0I4J1_COCNU|nr:hypothetical protein COCNU_04G000120 [Cocos nucifera]